MTQSAPTLLSVVEPIRRSEPFRRLIRCLRDADLAVIYDCHAHTCASRGGIRPEATATDIAETPANATGIADIIAFYDALFGPEAIEVRVVVFDTPLLAYDLRVRNEALLAEASASLATERIAAFAVITPDMRRDEIEGYVARGARGFKVSPRTTGTYAKTRRIADVRLHDMLTPDLLAAASERELPLLVHLPESVSGPSLSRSMLGALDEAMAAHASLTLVLAHLGMCQTPARVRQLLDWIAVAGLGSRVYLDVSTVTVAAAMAAALSSPAPVIFGTDLDFGFVETGRYLLAAEHDGRAVLTDARDAAARAYLVGAHYGRRYRALARRAGVSLDAPLFVYQLEAILDALDGIEPSQRRAVIRALFAENAQLLLGR